MVVLPVLPQQSRASLLGHLAARFRRPAEVMATESLCYLTTRHPQLREALVSLLLLDTLPIGVRDGIRFATEVTSADDQGRTDVEGSVDGRTLIVIEGKFGAPLQDTQPAAYAARLEAHGTLLFVCPPQRISRLIGQLHTRAMEGLTEAATGTGWVSDAAGIQWLPLTAGRRLGIVSWGGLLAAVARSAGPLSDAAASDVHQLEGLVARFESDLLAWTPEWLERGGSGPAFVLALQSADSLVDVVKAFPEVTWEKKTDKNAGWKRARQSGASSEEFYDWYGMMVRIAGVPVALAFEPTTWGTPGFPTPLQIELDVRGVDEERGALLYPVYLAMVEAAAGFQGLPGSGPVEPSPYDQNWWRVPFPLQPGLAGEEARSSIDRVARAVLEPLVGLAHGGGTAPSECGSGGLTAEVLAGTG